MRLYYAGFYALLNYSIILWGASPHMRRVFILQKKVVRILTDSCVTDHCRPLFRNLKMLTVPSIYIYNCLIYTKDHLQNLPKRSDVHKYDTRSADTLNIPYHRLSLTQQSIEYQGIKLFNKLNVQWKFENVAQFKKKLKIYLQDKAYYSIQEYLEE